MKDKDDKKCIKRICKATTYLYKVDECDEEALDKLELCSYHWRQYLNDSWRRL